MVRPRGDVIETETPLKTRANAIGTKSHDDNPARKTDLGASPTSILLENVMKATGCTLEEARSLMIDDDDLDNECEH